MDLLKKKCDYMLYLTGGFYACSQKLKERKDGSECVKNFFDSPETLGVSFQALQQSKPTEIVAGLSYHCDN